MIVKVIAAIIAVFLASQTEATAGDNLKEFGLLCQIVAACGAGIPTTDSEQQPKISDVLETLVAINLSAADDDFFSRNFAETSDHKGETNYTTYSEQWQKLKANTLKRKIGRNSVELTRLPANSIRLHVQLEALAAIEAVQNAAAQLPPAKTAAQINADLKGIVYGDGNTEPQASGSKTFGNPGAAACGGNGAASNKAGISLANDMLCLCGGNSNNNAAAGCISTGGTLTTKFNSEANGPNAFRELAGKCHHKDAQEGPTAEHLTSLATTFRHLIGSHAGSEQTKIFHYGKGAQATCTAADEEGCVNYKHQLQTGGSGIPWLVKLQKTIADIRRREIRREAVRQLESEAKQAERKVLLAYKQAHALGAITAPQQTAQATQNTKPTVEQQHKCAKFNSSETECTKNNCDYVKTKKECKPKPGTENTAAGTGETPNAGANSESKKCSEKTKQEECKDGCKWEDNKCKDYSFLFHKKMALSMSAAFVSLVALYHFKVFFAQFCKN
uniref:Variant surface glycoprotein 720 n=1 Tax=Trypanosoma brucei TaxID=5691 RepID=M4T2B7_9TRYP|nr:variant surface glycoprotein 720 [Trypanosoma brucei]